RSDRDWSSDVCSSDLPSPRGDRHALPPLRGRATPTSYHPRNGSVRFEPSLIGSGKRPPVESHRAHTLEPVRARRGRTTTFDLLEIGRASCRESVENAG